MNAILHRWPEGFRSTSTGRQPSASDVLASCFEGGVRRAAGKPSAGLGFLTEQLHELVIIGRRVHVHSTGNPIELIIR